MNINLATNKYKCFCGNTKTQTEDNTFIFSFKFIKDGIVDVYSYASCSQMCRVKQLMSLTSEGITLICFHCEKKWDCRCINEGKECSHIYIGNVPFVNLKVDVAKLYCSNKCFKGDVKQAQQDCPSIEMNKQCSGCGALEAIDVKGEAKKMKVCSRCKRFYYCSPQCQAKDWKIHKHECR
jgi:hypothetical protein